MYRASRDRVTYARFHRSARGERDNYRRGWGHGAGGGGGRRVSPRPNRYDTRTERTGENTRARFMTDAETCPRDRFRVITIIYFVARIRIAAFNVGNCGRENVSLLPSQEPRRAMYGQRGVRSIFVESSVQNVLVYSPHVGKGATNGRATGRRREIDFSLPTILV